jgi:hypothetical protein
MATEETVSTIAKALGESDELPVTQITGVVRVLGEELSLKLLEETKQIESKGGMMLPDNSRKRTPGGVFFFLARQKLSQEDKLIIFRAPKPAKAPVSEQAAPPESRFPRRRVIEVAPTSRPLSSRNPRPGFLPPELPVAVKRVKVKETVVGALGALPAEDQYSLLLDLLAELHDRLGYRVPESQRAPATTPRAAAAPPPPAFDPPTRPGAAVNLSPPSSQRPILLPESARVATGEPAAPAAAPEKVKRATATRAKRSS